MFTFGIFLLFLYFFSHLRYFFYSYDILNIYILISAHHLFAMSHPIPQTALTANL